MMHFIGEIVQNAPHVARCKLILEIYNQSSTCPRVSQGYLSRYEKVIQTNFIQHFQCIFSQRITQFSVILRLLRHPIQYRTIYYNIITILVNNTQYESRTILIFHTLW